MEDLNSLLRWGVRQAGVYLNGKFAKLKAIAIQEGESPTDQVLQLRIGYTSYFTALGTNIHLGGYQYGFHDLPPEPPLPQDLHWPASPDWRAALVGSPLANHLAMHLFLYSDQEILYVRRGPVGEAAGLWSTTANGAMEFKEGNPDLIDGKPSIGATARRETAYELSLKVDPRRICWLGVMATAQRCKPFVVGVYKITDKRELMAIKALEGKEQRELAEISRSGLRRKEIRAIRISGESHPIELSAGGILTIPFME